MRTWLDRVRRMTAADYVTAFEVVVVALWIEIALRVMPVARLLDRANPDSSRTRNVTPPQFHRLVRLVAVAYEILPLPTTCLRQSLVLNALLSKRGVPSRVCFGVARSDATFDAHAWIECDGMTSDTTAARFSELRSVSQFSRTSRLSRI